jgi:hypothetical protein
MAVMARPSNAGLLIAAGLSLALAGLLMWAVLAGGYPAGIVLPGGIILGVLGIGARTAWQAAIRRSGGEAARSSWALGNFVLGVLMGWLCAELLGYLLLPLLWLLIVPRARRRGLISATLPPFGLGFITLPLFFLVLDLSSGYSSSIVLWFTPELVIGVLLMATYLRQMRSAPTAPAPGRMRV